MVFSWEIKLQFEKKSEQKWQEDFFGAFLGKIKIILEKEDEQKWREPLRNYTSFRKKKLVFSDFF